jgi:hypothetical protein
MALFYHAHYAANFSLPHEVIPINHRSVVKAGVVSVSDVLTAERLIISDDTILTVVMEHALSLILVHGVVDTRALPLSGLTSDGVSHTKILFSVLGVSPRAEV